MLIADTHVHIYPAYDVEGALVSAYHRLSTLGVGGTVDHVALLLTERHDCSFYRDVITGRLRVSGFDVQPSAESGAVILQHAASSIGIIIYAGRQVVTRDGIEVLALLTEADIPDRLTTDETLTRIRAAGGLPVLSWAPGKWFGRRGKVIRALIDQAVGEPLALGDTSLRPLGWSTPCLMRRGRGRGLPVLAGSDPLPFVGDDVSMGRYAICSKTFDAAQPVSSMRALLLGAQFSVVGRRDSLPRMIRRWVSNQRMRKTIS